MCLKVVKGLAIALSLFALSGCSAVKAEPSPSVTAAAPVAVKSERYTAHGRYYLNGTLITSDGNEWGYSTDSISNETPFDGMPVYAVFDDNGTPSLYDDVVCGLVYDRTTAIMDEMEAAFSDDFEMVREGNSIVIKGMK